MEQVTSRNLNLNWYLVEEKEASIFFRSKKGMECMGWDRGQNCTVPSSNFQQSEG